MKRVMLLFALLMSMNVLSATEFPGFFVNMDRDTIQCRFDVRVHLFQTDLLDQLSFRKKVKIILKDGTKVKYKPDQIRMFQIDSTSLGSEWYVPLQVLDGLYFVRVVEKGEINLYQHFFLDIQSGMVEMKYVLQAGHRPSYVIDGLFWRKKVFKYMDRDEWLAEHLFEESIKYNNLPELIINYNLRN